MKRAFADYIRASKFKLMAWACVIALGGYSITRGSLTPFLTGTGVVCEGGKWLEYYLKHNENLSVKMNGRPLLTCLIERASYEDVEELLELGANTEDILTTVGINVLRGFTPIEVAVHEERNDIVQLLLKYNAQIPEHLLWYSTTIGAADSVKTLLDYGADVDDGGRDGESSLYSAAISGRIEIFNILIDYQADTEAKNIVGQVPLHAAAIAGEKEIVEQLLTLGANPSIRSYEGRTPLDFARRGGHTEVMKLLQNSESRQSADID